MTCSRCGLTSGSSLEHEWIEATCTEPRTCSLCGVTDGDALGHIATEATCTEPSVCSVCGEILSQPLGHVILTSNNIVEPTCTEAGIQSGICEICNETIEEEIPASGHKWEEWVVLEEPTTSKRGKRARTCQVCGEVNEENMPMIDTSGIKDIFKKTATRSYSERDNPIKVDIYEDECTITYRREGISWSDTFYVQEVVTDFIDFFAEMNKSSQYDFDRLQFIVNSKFLDQKGNVIEAPIIDMSMRKDDYLSFDFENLEDYAATMYPSLRDYLFLFHLDIDYDDLRFSNGL